MHGALLCLAIAIMVLIPPLTDTAVAQTVPASHTAERMLVQPPPGFTESCARYNWLCGDHALAVEIDDDDRILDLARQINSSVNGSVRQATDPEIYGVADHWTLPSSGRGDCEDFVLQKYKLLMQAGVDGRRLAVAVVLDRRGDNHAVLVLRLASGDVVLDSLSTRILRWNETGYRFLAMQSSDLRTQWEIITNQARGNAFLAER